MKHTILTQEYEKKFVDVTGKDYPPETLFYLRGMATAIEDSNTEWRPTLSELIKKLRKTQNKNFLESLIAAGSAYGAAKQIKNGYPGPAILLFGSAVNVIGKKPQVELKKSIKQAKEKLKKANLKNDNDILAVIEAAEQRASFDKVSEMLRCEFKKGLMLCGKYSESKVDTIVKKIVAVTHEVRHKALIDRFGHQIIKPKTKGTIIADTSKITNWTSNTDLLNKLNLTGLTTICGKSFLHTELLPYAEIGCANVILIKLHCI